MKSHIRIFEIFLFSFYYSFAYCQKDTIFIFKYHNYKVDILKDTIILDLNKNSINDKFNDSLKFRDSIKFYNKNYRINVFFIDNSCMINSFDTFTRKSRSIYFIKDKIEEILSFFESSDSVNIIRDKNYDYCFYFERYYFNKGNLKDSVDECHLLHLNTKIKNYDGIQLRFYDNGQIYSEKYYSKGKRNGIWKSFNREGILMIEEKWNNDSLINRKYYGNFNFDEFLE